MKKDKNYEPKSYYYSNNKTVEITINGRAIPEERIRSFRIDMARAKLAVEKKRRTPDEAGLFIIRRYPDYELIFKNLMSRMFLVLADEFENNNYIKYQDGLEFAFDRYNEYVKNLQELKRLDTF